MDSLRNVVLVFCALGVGCLALFSLAHLMVMAALRLRLVGAIWLATTLFVMVLALWAIEARFGAAAVWSPLLFALAIAAPISRELSDYLAWELDREIAKGGWLKLIDSEGRKGYRGHIYRAAAAQARTRFEAQDDPRDPWLLHWAAAHRPSSKAEEPFSPGKTASKT
ncbi:hypothetical protein [Caulobacter sp.]|uniref:hypothetical protein n=1 Tax=Caulobacter sp. TaxID=78 RepID=UPI0031D12558